MPCNQSLQTHCTNVKAHIARCELFSIISICFNHINVQTCSNHEKNDMSCLYIYIYTYRQCTRLSDVRNFSLCDDAADGTSTAAHYKESCYSIWICYCLQCQTKKDNTMRHFIYQFETKQRGWSLNSTSWAWWIESQQAIPVNAHEFSKFPA